MANTIKLKRASGSNPGASDLAAGELAIRTSNCALFSKNDSGNVVQINASQTENDFTTTLKNKLDGIAASAIANIVEDTSPQLGGNLDVQSNKITTATSNGNVKIEPNGSGVVEVRGAGGNDGKLQLNCSAQSHGIKLASPAHSAGQSYTLIFPDNQIAADKYLKIKSISGSGSTAIGQLEFEALDANDLGEGTIPDARFPSTLPALNGSALTNLNIVTDTSPQLGGDLQSNGNDIDFADNDKAVFGTGQDFEIFYNGTNTVLGHTADSGAVIIQAAPSESSIRCNASGSVDLYYNNTKTFETLSGGNKFTGFLFAGDNAKIFLGASNDLEIFHDGSNSRIENNTGQLKLKAVTAGTSVQMLGAGDEMMVQAISNGAVELYHDNSKKFETYTYGVNVSGTAKIESGGNFYAYDNVKFVAGTGEDLQIYHSGSNNFVDSVNNHDLILRAGTADAYVQGSDVFIGNEGGSKKYIDAHENGAVELYNNHSLKLETTSGGVTITGTDANDGTIIKGDLRLNKEGETATRIKWDGSDGQLEVFDDIKIAFGDSHDLQIYHNGTDNFVDNSNGNLKIRLASNVDFIELQQDRDVWIKGNPKPWDNNTYALGTSSYKWSAVHATAFYGDGSNLTNLPGGGKILQVLHGSLDGSFGTGSGTYQATGCSVNITMSGNNKVYVMAGATVNNTSAGDGGKMTVYRGSTNIATNGNDIAGYWQEDNSNNVEQSVFLSALDTPGTGTHTYQVYIHAHGGTFYWGYRNTGVITIMEVEA